MKHTLNREQALELAKTEWWTDVSPERLVRFQLFTDELCCPFSVFHEALKTCLGRLVLSHEFASEEGIINLRQEFLGERPAPTFQEVLELLPKHATKIILP